MLFERIRSSPEISYPWISSPSCVISLASIPGRRHPDEPSHWSVGLDDETSVHVSVKPISTLILGYANTSVSAVGENIRLQNKVTSRNGSLAVTLKSFPCRMLLLNSH